MLCTDKNLKDFFTKIDFTSWAGLHYVAGGNQGFHFHIWGEINRIKYLCIHPYFGCKWLFILFHYYFYPYLASSSKFLEFMVDIWLLHLKSFLNFHTFCSKETFLGAFVVFNPKNSLRLKNWSIAVWAACMKKNKFFSFYFSKRVNYIFYKLSANTKHVQFWLRMSLCDFLFEMGIKFIFPVLFEELSHAAMWPKLPKGWRAGC
jgi:hypothetical protein